MPPRPAPPSVSPPPPPPPARAIHARRGAWHASAPPDRLAHVCRQRWTAPHGLKRRSATPLCQHPRVHVHAAAHHLLHRRHLGVLLGVQRGVLHQPPQLQPAARHGTAARNRTQELSVLPPLQKVSCNRACRTGLSRYIPLGACWTKRRPYVISHRMVEPWGPCSPRRKTTPHGGHRAVSRIACALCAALRVCGSAHGFVSP